MLIHDIARPILNITDIEALINEMKYNIDFEYVNQELIDLVKNLGVENQVTINKDYLSSADIQTLLSQQDIIIFPYQKSNESSSAAVRDGLSSLPPVLPSGLIKPYPPIP